MKNIQIPRWDLSNVYPSIDSPELLSAIVLVNKSINDIEDKLSAGIEAVKNHGEHSLISFSLGTVLSAYNELLVLSGTVRAYISSFVSTDSRNHIARKKLSEYDLIEARIRNIDTRLQYLVGSISSDLNSIISSNPITRDHEFALRELADQSQYLMSEKEETLASELGISGSRAWAKLQGTLTSQLSVDLEINGETKKLPMPALINLHSNPDEGIRKIAYNAEMQAWKTIEEPLASAINGIKGAEITLFKKRGRQDALQSTIDNAHIDRETLDAMLTVMQNSFPKFRSYFSKKADRIGKEKLAWWDLFAPIGSQNKNYTWGEACDLILGNFRQFSPNLSSFAQRAIDNSWIDAEQREGKRGGAFCMGVPGVKESRILCNFDGSLDQVSTIAHELGHAFHNDCAYKAGKTAIQKNTPMTLAETASIMCENIILDAAYNAATSTDEKLAILETRLIGDAQVIVDIYSRFLFEKEVFERREKSELSANELCEIMETAQRKTYGQGLDEKYLMKYMWTWKPHYYSPDLSFYNFPYAFGLLFSTGLYAIYQKKGAEFVPDYIRLLSSTGEASAADLADKFGINIRTQEFWSASMEIITSRIDQYLSL